MQITYDAMLTQRGKKRKTRHHRSDQTLVFPDCTGSPISPESLSDLIGAHLQQAAGGGADVRHGLVLYDGDQQGREQDVGHLPVEEVHSVVGLRHHGGLVPAGGVVLHALWRVWSGGWGGGGAKEERQVRGGHIQSRTRLLLR